MRPVARRRGLVVRELRDEVVVYDRDCHQAHCLNRTAALVFRNADGHHTIPDLAAMLGAEDPEGVQETLVVLTLERLAEAHLMEGGPAAGSAPDLSRRAVMRRVGLGAAVLLAVVASILAPTPAEAAATCVRGQNCCQGQPDGTSCGLSCTSTCLSNVCQDGTC